MYSFEARMPKSTFEIQKKKIQKQLNRYNDFFLKHIDFGQYIEMGYTHFDSFYFVRLPLNEYPVDVYDIQTFDTEFNTPKDYLLAQFQAYGLMVIYLKNRLLNLGNENNKFIANPKFKLKGTASKTDFIELTYALIASGSVQGDIKELIRGFETILNIELNDYYRTFTAIRNRTNNPSKFLDQLKISLLNRIEEIED